MKFVLFNTTAAICQLDFGELKALYFFELEKGGGLHADESVYLCPYADFIFITELLF